MSGLFKRPGPPSSDDDERFTRLYEDSSRDLLAFLLRRCATAEDAADCLAESYRIAWETRTRLPAGHEARPWLFGVARNIARQTHRGETRRAATTSALATAAEHWYTPSGPEDSALAAALAELSPDRPGDHHDARGRRTRTARGRSDPRAIAQRGQNQGASGAREAACPAGAFRPRGQHRPSRRSTRCRGSGRLVQTSSHSHRPWGRNRRRTRFLPQSRDPAQSRSVARAGLSSQLHNRLASRRRAGRCRQSRPDPHSFCRGCLERRYGAQLRCPGPRPPTTRASAALKRQSSAGRCWCRARGPL